MFLLLFKLWVIGVVLYLIGVPFVFKAPDSLWDAIKAVIKYVVVGAVCFWLLLGLILAFGTFGLAVG